MSLPFIITTDTLLPFLLFQAIISMLYIHIYIYIWNVMVTLIIGSQILKAFCAVFGICARKNFIQRIFRWIQLQTAPSRDAWSMAEMLWWSFMWMRVNYEHKWGGAMFWLFLWRASEQTWSGLFLGYATCTFDIKIAVMRLWKSTKTIGTFWVAATGQITVFVEWIVPSTHSECMCMVNMQIGHRYWYCLLHKTMICKLEIMFSDYISAFVQ